jgi:hypothetical protein
VPARFGPEHPASSVRWSGRDVLPSDSSPIENALRAWSSMATGPFVFPKLMPAGLQPDGFEVVPAANAFKSVAAEPFAALSERDAELTIQHWRELVDHPGGSDYHGWQDLPMGRVDSRLTP